MADIPGTSGPDRLDGTGADDTITGFEEDDTLKGASGDDVIIGGDGADGLLGNSGDDWLRARDRIEDFSIDLDRFRLDPGERFTAIRTGDFDGDGAADDTRLTHAGGEVDVFGVTLPGDEAAALSEWNELVV